MEHVSRGDDDQETESTDAMVPGGDLLQSIATMSAKLEQMKRTVAATQSSREMVDMEAQLREAQALTNDVMRTHSAWAEQFSRTVCERSIRIAGALSSSALSDVSQGETRVLTSEEKASRILTAVEEDAQQLDCVVSTTLGSVFGITAEQPTSLGSKVQMLCRLAESHAFRHSPHHQAVPPSKGTTEETMFLPTLPCGDPQIVLQRVLELLGFPNDESKSLEKLSVAVCAAAVETRQRLERAQTERRMLALALEEYEHTVRQIASLAGIEKLPSAQGVAARLLRHTQSPATPGKGSSSERSPSVERIISSRYPSFEQEMKECSKEASWAVTFCERMKTLCATLGHRAPAAASSLSPSRINQFKAFANSASTAATQSSPQECVVPTPSVREDLDRCMTELENAVTLKTAENASLKEAASRTIVFAEQLLGDAEEQGTEPRKQLPADANEALIQKATRIKEAMGKGDNLPTRVKELIPLLPEEFRSHVKRESEGGLLHSTLDAVAMSLKTYQSMALQTLITPAIMRRCIDTINRTITAPAEGQEPPSDWSIALDFAGIDCADLVFASPSTTQEGLAESLEGAVQALGVRAEKLAQGLAAASHRIHSKDNDVEEVLHETVMALSNMVLPQHLPAGIANNNSIEAVKELNALVSERFEDLMAQAQRAQRVADSNRSERSKLEELLKQRVTKLVEQLREYCQADSSDVSAKGAAALPPGAPSIVLTGESLVDELKSRIDVLRGRCIKAKLDRTQLENANETHKIWLKRWTSVKAKVAKVTQLVCEPKDQPTTDEVVEPLDEQVDSSLEHCIAVLKEAREKSTPILDAAKSVGEMAQLRETVKQKNEEASDLDAALRVVYSQLCDVMKLVDSSVDTYFPEGDQMEDSGGLEGPQAATSATQEKGTANAEGDDVGDRLAYLLKRFKAQATKLLSFTRDNADTLRRCLHYLKSVHWSMSRREIEIHDGCLMDMEQSLLQLSDDLLAQSQNDQKQKGEGEEASDAVAVAHVEDGQPCDHRLIRIHETLNRVQTTLTAIRQLRYILSPDSVCASPLTDSAPVATGFCDILATPQNSPPLTNEDLLRSLENNLKYIDRKLNNFGSSLKSSAILIQRDVESAQTKIAHMLDSLTTINTTSVGVAPEEVQRLATSLANKELTGMCYFPSEEGAPPLWCEGLNAVHAVFDRTVQSLVKWFKTAQDYTEIINGVMDAVESGDKRAMPAAKDEKVTENALNSPPQSENAAATTASSPSAAASGLPPTGSVTIRKEDLPKYVRRLIEDARRAEDAADLELQLADAQMLVGLEREKSAVAQQNNARVIESLRCEVEKLQLERDTLSSEAAIARTKMRQLQQHLPAETSESLMMFSPATETTGRGNAIGIHRSHPSPRQAISPISSTDSPPRRRPNQAAVAKRVQGPQSYEKTTYASQAKRSNSAPRNATPIFGAQRPNQGVDRHERPAISSNNGRTRSASQGGSGRRSQPSPFRPASTATALTNRYYGTAVQEWADRLTSELPRRHLCSPQRKRDNVVHRNVRKATPTKRGERQAIKGVARAKPPSSHQQCMMDGCSPRSRTTTPVSQPKRQNSASRAKPLSTNTAVRVPSSPRADSLSSSTGQWVEVSSPTHTQEKVERAAAAAPRGRGQSTQKSRAYIPATQPVAVVIVPPRSYSKDINRVAATWQPSTHASRVKGKKAP